MRSNNGSCFLCKGTQNVLVERICLALLSSAITLTGKSVKDVLPTFVNDLTVFVHHVVVLHDMLADIKVAPFNPLQRALNGTGNNSVLQRHVIGNFELLHHGLQPVPTEEPHEIIFHGNKELAISRVSLTAGASSQLIINTPGLVALSTENAETPQGRNTLSQLDVCSASGHVRCDGHSFLLPCARNNFCFLLVMFRIENLMRNPFLLQ